MNKPREDLLRLKYGHRVKNARAVLGFTQKELANFLEATQATVSRAENNIKRFSRSKELKIISAAELSSMFFDSDNTSDIERLQNNKESMFLALVPEAKEAGLSLTAVRQILKVISQHKMVK